MWGAVHPRVCGEHRRAPPLAGGGAGSSPRVRGTPFGPSTIRAMTRFIPACAGNTAGASSSVAIPPVHPRVCGEHHAARRIPPPKTVHPRVCGEHASHCTAAVAEQRFIPACAGNTVSRSSIVSSLNGSSPRVRGTPVQLAPERVYYWFIPACAGNTRPGNRRPAPDTVHPRVCGEHQNRCAPHPARHRFIPACAGNTRTPHDLRPFDSVHPRVCGEHSSRIQPMPGTRGSSPRVRGTRRPAARRRASCRFIPACAGNTISQRLLTENKPVHPRVCGEHHTL